MRSLATLNARKRLLFAEAESQGGPKQPTCIDTWSDEENKALVEFVLFHAQEGRWPTFPKSSKFWAEVAEYVQKRGGSDSRELVSGLELRYLVYKMTRYRFQAKSTAILRTLLHLQ